MDFNHLIIKEAVERKSFEIERTEDRRLGCFQFETANYCLRGQRQQRIIAWLLMGYWTVLKWLRVEEYVLIAAALIKLFEVFEAVELSAEQLHGSDVGVVHGADRTNRPLFLLLTPRPLLIENLVSPDPRYTFGRFVDGMLPA